MGDGCKALFLRNRGTAVNPRLETEDVFEQDNPATRDQGTDSPGRGAGSFRNRAPATLGVLRNAIPIDRDSVNRP